MRIRLLIPVLGAALSLAGAGGALAATAPATSTPPVHHGLLSRLRHPHTAGANAGSPAPFAGAIIGNKRTHVYHLAGEKGTLPTVKNRVYFHSVAEARAAGYHPVGQHSASATRRHPHATGRSRPITDGVSGR